MSGHSGRPERAAPLEAPEFAALMAACGPWPPAPRLAVAVSGGTDSLALVLLAQRWFRDQVGESRSGRFVALTVDHGLRAESAVEALQVGAWLAARDIEHHVLTWRGSKPTSDVQAAARRARYRLLEGWCRRHRIDHLLLAHHLEDQAETFLLRLARGSGIDGLAAMARLRAGRPMIARPLLDVPRARLAATLRAWDQDWIRDPSNEDTAFARVRMRRLMPHLAREGLSAVRLAATARHMARARAALEHYAEELLAACASAGSAGFVRLDPAPLVAAPEEIGLRALAAVLGAVGGGDYRPRLVRLERLYRAIADGDVRRGRTLSGCRIVPMPRRLARSSGELLVVREAAAVAAPLALGPGRSLIWDGRFRVRRSRSSAPGTAPKAWVRALGHTGWRQIARACDSEQPAAIPAPARAVLPALCSARGTILAVPHLGYLRPGSERCYGRFRADFPAVPWPPAASAATGSTE